uniref:Cathepsin propeptide inhibitor domain-containing protein n=1 Tax=Triticum urartu TaxID=4572 RepID=A0A8R7V1S2_TRIUA
MFRRAVGSLLARGFSPRATPRTAPARSLHFLSDLAIGNGLLGAYVFAAGLMAGGGGGLVILHFKQGAGVDASAAAGKLNHKVKFKKPDMKQRFESWIIEHEKTYRDEEEKAMRFELFKAALEMMESQLPSVEESGVLPQVSCFADFTAEEKRKLLAFPNGVNITEYNEMVKSAWAKQQKGLFFCNLFILEYALASLNRILLYPFCFRCQIGPGIYKFL